MRDIATKVTDDTLTAEEFNDIPTELENVITSMGFTLTSADLAQLVRAISHYASFGEFYSATGTNSYVLSTIGSRVAPNSYVDGMRIRFVNPNANTGACTVNVAGLGVVDLRMENGMTALVAGDLPSGYVEAVYIASNAAFDLRSVYAATDTRQGLSERATIAEAIAGLDNSRFITSASLSAVLGDNGNTFQAGTRSVFYQAAAPSGWTLYTSLNDRVLRVVSTAGGGIGGSWSISGLTVQNTVLLISHMPPHSHSEGSVHRGDIFGITQVYGSAQTGITSYVHEHHDSQSTGKRAYTSSQGGGDGHAHGMSSDSSWRPSYVDVIICTKN